MYTYIQAALLMRVEVCRGKRAEFVLTKWEDFSPFFEPQDRDLTDGALARKLHQLHQVTVASERRLRGPVLQGEIGGSNPKALLPVRGQVEILKSPLADRIPVETASWADV